MVAAIVAGGKGTRLSSITKNEIPKPMVLIHGKPILEHQIETLARNGVKKIYLLVGHLHEVIEQYFGDGAAHGVSIEYVVEKEPLGSAGALYYLKGRVTEPLLVVFGDLMLEIDVERLLAFHAQKAATITLVVHPNSHPYDSDLLVLDGTAQAIRFDSKSAPRDGYYSNIVNAGVYVLDPSVLQSFQELRKTDLDKDIVQRAILSSGKVYGYRTTEYVKDVGTPERLAAAERDIDRGLVKNKSLKVRQKCIFLDRDGTINKYVGLLTKEQQFVLEHGVAEALKMINDSGFLAVVVTNQPVIARNLCSIEQLDQIHRKMETLLGRDGAFVDDILYCPHHPDGGYPEERPEFKIECNCRKPKIGLILEAAKRHHLDLSQSWMIGDTTTDIQTGKNAGLRTVLLQTGERGTDGKFAVRADFEAAGLVDAVRTIVQVAGIRKQESEMKNYTSRIEDYLRVEIEVLKKLDVNEISKVMNVLEETRHSGTHVYVCGNGGSAATASHFAVDFNKGVSVSHEKKYSFVCLNDNVPTITAIANDIGYDRIFDYQLRGRLRKGDVLMALSGSGNSVNVVNAVKYAKEIGSSVIGVTGYSGGIVDELADYHLHVAIDNMQIAEDVHMILDHIMMSILCHAEKA